MKSGYEARTAYLDLLLCRLLLIAGKRTPMDIPNAWFRTLLEWQTVTHYHDVYRLILPTRSLRNPLLEDVLPSIMLIKAVAVFDEAIADTIGTKHGGLVKGYKDDLNGRIRFLVDRNLVSNGAELHETRSLRNELAHEGNRHATWNELEKALRELESGLQDLKVVGPRPTLEFYFERSGVELSEEKGVLGTRKMEFGVKANDVVAYKAKWIDTLHRLGPNASGLD